MSAALAVGSTHSVAVFVQLIVHTCTVGTGSGTLAGANVTHVAVSCATNTFTIGGTISGLSGTGLVLQNNGGDNLAVSASRLTFRTPVGAGPAYGVPVFTQPPNPSKSGTVP